MNYYVFDVNVVYGYYQHNKKIVNVMYKLKSTRTYGNLYYFVQCAEILLESYPKGVVYIWKTYKFIICKLVVLRCCVKLDCLTNTHVFLCLKLNKVDITLNKNKERNEFEEFYNDFVVKSFLPNLY